MYCSLLLLLSLLYKVSVHSNLFSRNGEELTDILHKTLRKNNRLRPRQTPLKTGGVFPSGDNSNVSQITRVKMEV